jgi:RNA polymerase sigma factor (sigma-70 family)
MNDMSKKQIFIENVLEHISSLKYFALSLSKNKFDADDLVSDTVVKAFEKFEGLKDVSKMRSWLFKILSNQFISNYRRKKKLLEIDVTGNENDPESFSLYETLVSSDYAVEDNPEIKFINDLNRKQIENAIEELPIQFRMALILCDIENFSYDEISKMLKVPVGTVRSRISRARGLLQKKLWAQAQELGIRTSKEIKKKPGYVCTCGKEENEILSTETIQ